MSVRVLGGEQILMTLVVDSAEGDPERLQQSVSVEDVRRLAVRDHPTGEQDRLVAGESLAGAAAPHESPQSSRIHPFAP